jgi:glutamyl-tRNA reductase
MDGPSFKKAKMDELDEKSRIEIGIIGMGDMGRLYASKFIEAGWK